MDNISGAKNSQISVLREILEKYQVTIPAHLEEAKLLPLFVKLNTTMIHTRSAVALGSGNKIADRDKSNGWSTSSLSEKRNNQKYLEPHPLNLYKDPLTKVCGHNENLKKMIEECIRINKERVENCGGMSDYIANYLWKYPGEDIFRIEVVGACDFDHVWVMINRKNGSSLLKPYEWGDAWIIDLWWGDSGRIYHASKFSENIVAMFEYLIIQKKAFNSNDVAMHEEAYNDYCDQISLYDEICKINLKSQLDILLDDQPYPCDITSCFKAIEDFYDYAPQYMSWGSKDKKDLISKINDDFINHKKIFTPCLDSIKNVSEDVFLTPVCIEKKKNVLYEIITIR